jgi:hypothetical protein
MTTNRSRSSPSEVLTQSFSRMPPVNSVVLSKRNENVALSFSFFPVLRYWTLLSSSTGSCSSPEVRAYK